VAHTPREEGWRSGLNANLFYFAWKLCVLRMSCHRIPGEAVVAVAAARIPWHSYATLCIEFP
jgi:hypothetical protein